MPCKFHHVLQRIYHLGNHVHELLIDYAEALIATHSRRKEDRHLQLVPLSLGSDTGQCPAPLPSNVSTASPRPVVRSARGKNRVRQFARVILLVFLMAGLFQVYRYAVDRGRADAVSPEESIRRDVAVYRQLVKLIDREMNILAKIVERNDEPAVSQYIILNEALNEDLRRVAALRERIASKKKELQRSP